MDNPLWNAAISEAIRLAKEVNAKCTAEGIVDVDNQRAIYQATVEIWKAARRP